MIDDSFYLLINSVLNSNSLKIVFFLSSIDKILELSD